ncbi:MAG: dephospho-CoA kinase [Xanthomonadales bacterium]|nr:dephospho-CoA kinase [Gammaproteobacteria bacterium]MBT8052578.1 dephospho-CoA kinase [Gammaproteobacteria bacterium]NND56663.1 dephospho-CoA kinase [Xanthomonadales bacterium]NNK52395.1 dephospho-CoA kinase [Xanthomonadales bacterium]
MKYGIFTVVLTGGIASGKSAVSDCFEQLGTPVVDTDRIAREVVQPGKPALKHIADEFGKDFLDSNGGLNRSRMRQEIFSDPKQKTRLEAILHPRIGEEVLRRVRALDAPYCIIVIPLYAESSSYAWIDRVLVVDVSEELQIERVMARDRISRDQASAILNSQASRETRLALADDIIENSGKRSELPEKVKSLHEKYLSLSQSSS